MLSTVGGCKIKAAPVMGAVYYGGGLDANMQTRIIPTPKQSHFKALVSNPVQTIFTICPLSHAVSQLWFHYKKKKL